MNDDDWSSPNRYRKEDLNTKLNVSDDFLDSNFVIGPAWSDFPLSPAFLDPITTTAYQNDALSAISDSALLSTVPPPLPALDGVVQVTAASSLHYDISPSLVSPHQLSLTASTTSSITPQITSKYEHQTQFQSQLLHRVDSSSKVVKSRSEQRRKRGKDGSSHAARSNVLTSGRPPQRRVVRDSQGNIISAFQVFGADQRVRSALSRELQTATTQSRRIGACARCRDKKLRCDIPENPLKPCPRCSKLPFDLLYAPCIREDLAELNLHRLGTTLDNSIQQWMSKQPTTPSSLHRKILLTQDMACTLEVTVAPFIPDKDDTTQYLWTDASGRVNALDLPTYYIVDMPEALENAEKYGLQNAATYIEALLDGTNPIIWKTFEAACHHAAVSKCPLVTSALTFWAVGRIIERYWRICGTNTLGQSPNLDRQNPWAGTMPVPPVMDTQLDEIVIRKLLIPARAKLLKQLQRMIDQKKKENWFAIYLAVFIVLCSVEWMISDVVDYTDHHYIPPRPPGKPSLTESYIHASKTLLAYFHFACGGVKPFDIDLSKEKLEGTALTLDQIVYIENMKKEIAKQKQHLNGLKGREMYKTEMFWCYQALDRKWQPDAPYNGTIDELAEEDFLIS